MMRYRYAKVKCLCGCVATVERYGKAKKCFCGAELGTEKDGNLEKPIATVPDGYPEQWMKNKPEIVGWSSR